MNMNLRRRFRRTQLPIISLSYGTQMEGILEVNSLREVTKTVVEAARESLAIGQA